MTIGRTHMLDIRSLQKALEKWS